MSRAVRNRILIAAGAIVLVILLVEIFGGEYAVVGRSFLKNLIRHLF